MIKETVLRRIRQALDTVVYNDTIKAYVISSRYWEDQEPDLFNLYSSFPALKRDLISEIVRRWS